MQGKRILLGISGGIAAYKIAYLIRILKKQGAEVRAIMTPASSDFISPLVVSTLSENPVHIEFWNKETGAWTNHVELALWADVLLIAPTTANTLAKMASGICDNLLLASYFSMKGKTIIAPAMDLDMYQHPTVKRNMETLLSDGVSIIPATEGALASGLEGQGRMEEPENIAAYLNDFFLSERTLQSKRILITAGPTYEAIDPVRFIGNHSSGKMGYEIATSCLSMGHQVILVSGPTHLSLTHPNLQLIQVRSAQEMLEAVQEHWKTCYLGIFSAAVADYRPAQVESQKIKKQADEFSLNLLKNPDILSWASANRSKEQKVVGFALETNNAKEFALDKLVRKNLDFIVLNEYVKDVSGFQAETNKITIFDKDKTTFEFSLKSKKEVAKDILSIVLKDYK
ncbi:MAG: bifunctional phosphopantothenoylcysteine decarboxylase/phosphopantothenate--cysteine ligase CoaBC [Crocinitomicaceae bacterium]|nr:bifunctional phosphopantothenoylcysteine decarboxylase/phosphopantothenate--cysteine ligase CoaBC [Crocinitomicaceae bacterium]MDP4760190.1 bifunctional phosphopantothenoylcysteine decarboxylase/phosphopantothenate--cysteine ligase CoaBC [Crocinitomicaceae bacterium]